MGSRLDGMEAEICDGALDRWRRRALHNRGASARDKRDQKISAWQFAILFNMLIARLHSLLTAFSLSDPPTRSVRPCRLDGASFRRLRRSYLTHPVELLIYQSPVASIEASELA